MKRVIDRLFIGALQDVCGVAPEGFATVHACKNPCYCRKVGKPKSGEPNYLSFTEGNDLWLNVVDPPTPLFKLAMFDQFLEFMAVQWTAGRSIAIHCNLGKSRAPSLALLFLAKSLGAIPDGSYDEAWDAFEALAGEYTPGKGIETYLRENWSAIKTDRLPYLEGAAAAPAPQVATTMLAPELAQFTPATPLDSLASIYNSPFVHFYAAARITDKEGVLTPADQHIVPNVFQSRACEAYEWFVANNVPVRLLLGPKPRQSGGSTISAELCLHHSYRFRCSGMMIGDENDRTDLIWNMMNRMADHDRFKSIWGVRHQWNTEKAHFYYTDENGEERELEWLRDTANDPKAGASGTRQVLWCSEAGRYSKEGKVTDTQVISNASSSVPDKPGTMIILESTAEGSNGMFFRLVQGAVTLEQRMRGEIGNGWIKVFCAWHECPDYFLQRTPGNEGWFADQLDEHEKRGVELYSWTAEQIAWRRAKINGVFDGNIKLFNQEFPASEEEAWISSGNARFNMEGLLRLEKLAKFGHSLAARGILEENGNVMQFITKCENPWLWVREQPLYGARYILGMDCMTGEQSAGSVKRDTHACVVWRAPYKDANGQFHDAKLVAAIDVPGGCRWDTDLLALRAYQLSQMYGSCIMVVEVNEALGVMRELLALGANLWKRTKADEASGIPGQTLKIPGWKTTAASKFLMVDAWAKVIREQSVDVEYLPVVQQLKTFVQHEDGSCSGKQGELDDGVMGGSLGLVCMDVATEFRPPRPVTPSVHLPDQSGFRSKGAGAF